MNPLWQFVNASRWRLWVSSVAILIILSASGITCWKEHIAADALLQEHLQAIKVEVSAKGDSFKVARAQAVIEAAKAQAAARAAQHDGAILTHRIDSLRSVPLSVTTVTGDSVRLRDTVYVVPTPVAEWMANADQRLFFQDSLLRIANYQISIVAPQIFARYDSVLAVKDTALVRADSALASLHRQVNLTEQEVALARPGFSTYAKGAAIGATALAILLHFIPR